MRTYLSFQILFAIQKQEKKSPVPEMTEAVTDRVLLQICSTTKKNPFINSLI
jgi:hypothetical protein